MTASKYVFSTLTGTQKYPTWLKTPGRDIPRMGGYVMIYGGANLPSKILVTPIGVMTPLSAEQFERVRASPGFKRHVARGFLIVADRPYELEEVVEDMEPKDASAPKVPGDFSGEEGDKAPSVASSGATENAEAEKAAAEKAAEDEKKKSDRAAARAQAKTARDAVGQEGDGSPRQRRGGVRTEDA